MVVCCVLLRIAAASRLQFRRSGCHPSRRCIAAASRFATVARRTPTSTRGCGLRPLLDLLQLLDFQSRRKRAGQAVLRIAAASHTVPNFSGTPGLAADCGRFSICYSHRAHRHPVRRRCGLRRFSICYSKLCNAFDMVRAADCGRFSICYSTNQREPSLAIAADCGTRFATYSGGWAFRRCGLRPLLDLLQLPAT